VPLSRDARGSCLGALQPRPGNSSKTQPQTLARVLCSVPKLSCPCNSRLERQSGIPGSTYDPPGTAAYTTTTAHDRPLGLSVLTDILRFPAAPPTSFRDYRSARIISLLCSWSGNLLAHYYWSGGINCYLRSMRGCLSSLFWVVGRPVGRQTRLRSAGGANFIVWR
jgi:hypothetical protein